MRFAGMVLGVAIATLSASMITAGLWVAQAQTDAPIRVAEKKKKAAPKAKDAGKKSGPVPAAYAGMPLASAPPSSSISTGPIIIPARPTAISTTARSPA